MADSANMIMYDRGRYLMNIPIQISGSPGGLSSFETKKKSLMPPTSIHNSQHVSPLQWYRNKMN